MRRKLTGLKLDTEAWECAKRIGRGAMYTGRSRTGRSGGLYRRENAGISSESGARGVADGQQVEIPVLPNELMKQ